MSDTPGSNSRPRNNRGGRNRNNNNNRGPRRDRDRRDRRREDQPGGRRDDRRKNEERRDPRPERRPPPPAAKPTLWQKVLTILTFGLVRPGSASKASGRPPKKPQSPKESQPPSQTPRQQTVPPATDPESVDTDRLHIGNLSYDATEGDLLDIFKGIGKVQNVDIVYNGRTHRSKGFGFVQMMSIADARRAVAELHGKTFMGRPLHLGPARSRGRDEREADDQQD